MRTLTALLLATTLTMGCATVHRKATYSATGAADLNADLKLLEEYKASRDEPLPKEAEQIPIFIDTMPEGITLKDNVVSVEEGYAHRILGKFTLEPHGGIFPPYKTSWRKPYCYPQNVLFLATLFIWGLVPTYYPCYATEALRKEEILDAAKHLAYEAGGDMVLASYGPMSSQTHATTLVGFIVKSDPRFQTARGPSDDDEEVQGGLGIMGVGETEE